MGISICPIAQLLQKVDKAFGDNLLNVPNIHLQDTFTFMEAWRKARVREALWQIFNRSKAYDGKVAADIAAHGFNSNVLHIWSRQLRVSEIVFPHLEPEALSAKLKALLGNAKVVSFLDLA